MSKNATMTVVNTIENSDASLPVNISRRITTNELYPTVIKVANSKIPINFDLGTSKIDPTPSVNFISDAAKLKAAIAMKAPMERRKKSSISEVINSSPKSRVTTNK